MNAINVIFGKRGRTTIPIAMRRKLDWQSGDTIRFWLDGDRVVITREHAHVPVATRKKPRSKLLALLIGGDGNG